MTISYKEPVKIVDALFSSVKKTHGRQCSIKYFYLYTHYKDAFNKRCIVHGTDLNLLIH